MDKSPWDSQNVTSILCVSQVLSQKAVLSFYKSMSLLPSPPNTMLKDQRNCLLTISTLSVGLGEGVETYSVEKRSNCTTVPRILSMIVVPLRITRCLRPVRKCLSQACKRPSIPLLFNFSRSRSWGTLSNALARSRKSTSVGRDKLRDLAQSFNDDNSCVTVDLTFRKPNWLLFIRPVSC